MEGRSTEISKEKKNSKSNKASQKNSPAQEKSSKLKSSLNICCLIQDFFENIFNHNNKKYYLKSLGELVDKSAVKSFISTEEQKMIKNIINIDDVKVSDVMVPRTYIVAMPKNSTLEQIRDMVISKEHTRMPIYEENLDEIIGFIHSKDLVKFLSHEAGEFNLVSLIRKIIYVPHSMKIVDLLRKMRTSRVHIAIVLDEYGGTDGLVTIKDIMGEIVGEMEDEHDFPENDIYNKVHKISNSLFHVGGRVEIEKIEELLEEKIVKEDEENFETIGGFILSEMKKVPQTGEVLILNSKLSFKILEADPRSIKLVEISKSN